MATAKPTLLAAIAGVAVLVVGGAGWMLLGAKHGQTAEMAKAGGPGAGPGGPGAGQRGPGGPGGGPGGGQRGARPVDVAAAPVEIHTFSERIEALGSLEPRERVQLTANAADRVTGVFFEDGRRVRKGQTLMTLAADEEHAQLDAARASQADAQRIYDRNQRLAQDQAISSKELETSRANAESTAATVRSLEARIRDRVLLAPFDGVLGFRMVSTGAYVSPGQVVATIIDDSEMRLEFGVPSLYVSQLKAGLPIEARTADLPNEVFKGALTSIDNAIDPVTRSVKVRATLPNPERRLRPGMFMTVGLMPSERSALSAPEIAIVSEGSDTFVFLVAKGPKGLVAKKTSVTVGAREKGIVEITAGLQSGDMVVTDGILKMRPDAPLKVKGDPAAGGPAGAGDARMAAQDGPSAKADLRR